MAITYTFVLQVEKPGKDFSHFSMSENTEDMVADPNAPMNQESRVAIDNYANRKRDEAQIAPHVTVMRSDFMPVS